MRAVKPDTCDVADPSSKHLRRSSNSLGRSEVCDVGGMMDDLSYADIAKIRRGIIENQRLEVELPIVDQTKSSIFAWCISMKENKSGSQLLILGHHSAIES